jgi:hypothetical protein
VQHEHAFESKVLGPACLAALVLPTFRRAVALAVRVPRRLPAEPKDCEEHIWISHAAIYYPAARAGLVYFILDIRVPGSAYRRCRYLFFFPSIFCETTETCCSNE